MSTTEVTTPSNLVTPTSDLLKVDSKRTINQELDKDAFINLLVTQMKYQDPLNPMDNQEMMAQMAQFSALEQMMNVAKAIEQQSAHALIGQQVQYQYEDESGTTQYAIGKIDYVKTQNGEQLFGIGENEISKDGIIAVIDATNIQSNTSAFDLLGKTVQGVFTEKNAQGVESEVVVEGEIQGIIMKSGLPYLTMGTDKNKVELAFENIQNIVEKPTLTGRWVTATYTDKEGKKQDIEGLAEYIKITKDSTYVYVNGQFVDFDDVKTVTNK
ncbi:flagellar hook capping FlgD N-terminal domain-containing protein [Sporanaerobium hydrogeniformans]|uniref:flagellar hook capping FlgD N-terminal domain-containing protein n=1 Tax=Sporanaerobium hydrogeniformans TaxID=3072179 RepID=UPI0015D4BC32|nr:flagellar hook capping FlgD N-terminal domain-containing protein [Sporanaerobium hydrogeniformans]